MLLDDNCCGQVMLSFPWWMKYTLRRRPFLSRGVLQRLDGPQCDQSTNKLRWDFSPAIDWKYCHQPFSWFAQFWAPADPRPALYEGKPGRGEWGGEGDRSSSSFLRCRIDHSQLGLCRFHNGAQRHGGEPGDLCAGAQLHLHVQLRTGDIFNHVLPVAIVSSPKWRF